MAGQQISMIVKMSCSIVSQASVPSVKRSVCCVCVKGIWLHRVRDEGNGRCCSGPHEQRQLPRI